MNGYTFLTPEQARDIRVDRIRQLEIEHYIALLLLEEDPLNEKQSMNVKELERRIEHHVQALTGKLDEGHQDGIPQEDLLSAGQEVAK